jgi:hypothetical protein
MVKLLVYMVISLIWSQDVWAGEHAAEGKATESNLLLTDIVVPVLLREEVQAYYSLSLTIAPKDESKKEVLIKFGPRVRDAIIKELYLILPLIWSKDSQPNIDMLKARLETVAQKTTPDDTIGLVTINAFQQNDTKNNGLDSDKKKS